MTSGIESEIGETLRILRNQRGLTQDDVSKMLNIKRQTYSAWERGISSPDINTIVFLARFYGVSTDHIFNYNIIATPGTQSFLTEESCAQAAIGTIEVSTSSDLEQKRFEQTVQAMKDYLIDRTLVAFGDTPGDKVALCRAMGAIGKAMALAIEELQSKLG